MLLLCKAISWRDISIASSLGMVPVRRLWESLSCIKDSRPDNSEGMVPESLAMETVNSTNDDSIPNSEGIVPDMPVKSKLENERGTAKREKAEHATNIPLRVSLSFSRSLKPESSVGMVPESIVVLIPKSSNDVINPSSEGSSPVMSETRIKSKQ